MTDKQRPRILVLPLHGPQKRRQIRSNHTHSNTPSLHIGPHVVMAIAVITPRKEYRSEMGFDVGEGGASEVGTVGYDAEDGWGGFSVGAGPHLVDGFGEVVASLFEFVGLDFVDDHSGYVYSVLQAQRTIQLQLIKRPSQSTIRHQNDIRPQFRRHSCISRPDNASHSGMPRSLANGNCVNAATVIPSSATGLLGIGSSALDNVQVRSSNIRHLTCVVDLSVEIILGISPRNEDGRHVRILQMVHLEMISDEFDILVYNHVLPFLLRGFLVAVAIVLRCIAYSTIIVILVRNDGDGFVPDAQALLPHGLHVAHVFGAKSFGEMRDEGQADGGFTDVLAGGCHVDGALVADGGGGRGDGCLAITAVDVIGEGREAAAELDRFVAPIISFAVCRKVVGGKRRRDDRREGTTTVGRVRRGWCAAN
mmetsp:Transcript_24066/g.50135  ORF Transcript_24066/g.50135 Transcript_24066/m.50135 type:complete len:422 (-) Transcript_24066:249-1514(-)